VALSGPEFSTVMVKVTVSPAVILPLLSASVASATALVKLKSAVGGAVSVSVSVDVLLVGSVSVTPAGGATVAVFDSDPEAVNEIVPVTV